MNVKLLAGIAVFVLLMAVVSNPIMQSAYAGKGVKKQIRSGIHREDKTMENTGKGIKKMVNPASLRNATDGADLAKVNKLNKLANGSSNAADAGPGKDDVKSDQRGIEKKDIRKGDATKIKDKTYKTTDKKAKPESRAVGDFDRDGDLDYSFKRKYKDDDVEAKANSDTKSKPKPESTKPAPPVQPAKSG